MDGQETNIKLTRRVHAVVLVASGHASAGMRTGFLG